MIVNWTGDGMKMIPAHIPTATDPSANSRFCTLAPGYNDVPDELWAEARTFVRDELAKGSLIEEWTKTPKPEKPDDYPLIWCDTEDARETKVIRVPAGIRDVIRPMVIERIIKNTFVPATLKKWSEEENRPDVQAALVKQIDAVNSGQIVG
jgi:hypothetical protein